MKCGVRKPSFTKSLSARNPMTQTKRKYSTKKYTDPLGTINKRAYNKVYNATTVGIKDMCKVSNNSSKTSHSEPSYKTSKIKTSEYNWLPLELREKIEEAKNVSYTNMTFEEIQQHQEHVKDLCRQIEEEGRRQREERKRVEQQQKQRIIEQQQEIKKTIETDIAIAKTIFYLGFGIPIVIGIILLMMVISLFF